MASITLSSVERSTARVGCPGNDDVRAWSRRRARLVGCGRGVSVALTTGGVSASSAEIHFARPQHALASGRDGSSPGWDAGVAVSPQKRNDAGLGLRVPVARGRRGLREEIERTATAIKVALHNGGTKALVRSRARANETLCEATLYRRSMSCVDYRYATRGYRTRALLRNFT